MTDLGVERESGGRRRSAVDPATLAEAVPDVLVAVDRTGHLVWANDAATEQLGLLVDDWVGRSVLELVHPDDHPLVVSSLESVAGKQVGTPTELRVRSGDGDWRVVEVLGRNRLDDLGVLVVSCRDLTRRRLWEVAQGEVARFQALVQHGASVTLLLDEHGVVHSLNNAFTRLLGHDPSVVAGRELAEFADPLDAHRLRAALRDAGPAMARVKVEVRMRPADGGASRPFCFEVVNLLDDPVVAGLVVTGHDIGELHDARLALEHQATHDALTGLPNRWLLQDRLSRALARSRRSGEPLAVLFVDLDRFKPINDLLGHEAGDELLVVLADRLRAAVRDDDTVARVGGDEFVIVAERRDRLDAARLAEHLEAVVAEPVWLRAGRTQVRASVGVTVVDGSVAGTPTATTVLAEADSAMCAVKAARRGERRIPGGRVAERRRIADELAVGLGRGELRAHLQPVFALPDRSLVGFEALVRWEHPTRGLLGPAAFLDVAEDAGLDVELGRVVLEQAGAALAAWGAAAEGLEVAVNLSVAQLADPTLPAQVRAVLDRTGLAPHRLLVEVAERATLERAASHAGTTPEEALLDLAALGVRLVLDDFGTGYSSLTHIRRFPLHALKVDRSFVADVVTRPEDRSVVAAVVGLAHALGMRVVAEGVEHPEQLGVLHALGCDAVQGFLLGRPAPPQELTPLVRSRVWHPGPGGSER